MMNKKLSARRRQLAHLQCAVQDSDVVQFVVHDGVTAALEEGATQLLLRGEPYVTEGREVGLF